MYERYHDEEWGVPVYDDAALFKILVLEGTQAGLSWITILRKRDNYKFAFDDFDAQIIRSDLFIEFGIKKPSAINENFLIVFGCLI